MIESDDQKDELPGVATVLSQGAMLGAFVGFLSLAVGMLSQSQSGYNFFLMFYLVPILLSGMVLGAFEGSIIWAWTHFAGRRLNVVLRGFIGVLTHAALMNLMAVVMAERVTTPKDVSATVYLLAIAYYVVFGVVFGLVVGSKFEPWYELFRGTTTTPWRCATTGLTGFVLRLAVTFGFMESILNLIYQQQRDGDRSEYTIALIAVIHFTAAIMLVFARMSTRLLLQLALLVNFPVVLLITEVLTNDTPMWAISLIYLVIWFAFLITRLTGIPSSSRDSVTT